MLVSFYILAYNHERLIGDAIQAALRQDHSPLEIIISDDCSTDGTWDVIQRSVAEYRGPHAVRARRNPSNQGIAQHINSVWRECRGDWIVASAGDDFSEPGRVRRIMQVVSERPGARLVQSWLAEVDEAGRPLKINQLGTDLAPGQVQAFTLRDRLSGLLYAPHGAAMAYSRQVVDAFGPLPEDVIFEDNVVNVRAELVGDAVVVAEPLVNHRNHPGQITHVEGVRDRATQQRRLRARLQSDVSSSLQNVTDIQRSRERLGPELFSRASTRYAQRARYFAWKKQALLAGWPRRLLSLALILPQGSRMAPLRGDECMRSALPDGLYEAYSAWRRARGGQGRR